MKKNLAVSSGDGLQRQIQTRALYLNLDVEDILTIKQKKSGGQALNASTDRSISSIITLTKLMAPDIETVRGKDIVLCLGPTRSGKSTTLLYLDGTSMMLADPIEQLGLNEDEVDADVVMVPVAKASHPFYGEIGHNAGVSHTFFPRCHPYPLYHQDDIFLYDFPGYFDASGWQIRIALDLVLRDLCDAARSVRVLVVVDADSIETGSGDIAKRVVEKLNTGFNQIKDHVVVGISKRPQPWSSAFQNQVNQVFKELDWISLDLEKAATRDHLIQKLLNKSGALRPTTHLISPADLDSFNQSMQSPACLKKWVTQFADKFRVSHTCYDDDFSEIGQLNALLDNIQILYDVSDWISTSVTRSLLEDLDQTLAHLLALQAPQLHKAIYDTEDMITNALLRHAITEVDALDKKVISKVGVLSNRDRCALSDQYHVIRRRVDEILNEKNMTLSDCRSNDLILGSKNESPLQMIVRLMAEGHLLPVLDQGFLSKTPDSESFAPQFLDGFIGVDYCAIAQNQDNQNILDCLERVSKRPNCHPQVKTTLDRVGLINLDDFNFRSATNRALLGLVIDGLDHVISNSFKRSIWLQSQVARMCGQKL